jgi:AAA ATPase-like protein
MTTSPNPFRPGFGSSPAVLAGRDDIVEQFAEAIDNGPGSLGRATLYTGARGTGKTVMLNEAADVARQRGWLVIEETASSGFVHRLVSEHLPGLLAELDPKQLRTRLTGATAPFGMGALDWQTADAHVVTAGLRNQLELVCDLLEAQGTGLLVTLDEVHLRQTDEQREFFVTVQHLFRNDRELAIAAAGLPSAVSSLLNDQVLTFLRRADRHTLGRVGLGEVARALTETIEGAGRTIAARVARTAAEATGGYPFLIQLVGYSIWRQRPDSKAISADDVERGVPAALRRMARLVHEPALADLSDVDRAFLVAMAEDAAESKIADIARRLGVDLNYTSVYRQRLIEAQMIEPAGRGVLRFTLPYLADYLRGHAAEQPRLPARTAS